MKKVWLITGASRGLGAEIARAVSAKGDFLVATSRQKEALAQFQGTNVFTAKLDVTQEEDAKTVVKLALDKFGQIDVLVNNAGYGFISAIEEANPQEIEAIYQTNVFGLLNVTRAVLPSMRARRTGYLINVASMGGYQASPVLGVYGSTKFAIEGLSEALHAELKPLGIKVSVIGPGAYRSDFLDKSSLRSAESRIDDYASMRAKAHAYAESNNHKQPGDPAKLAQTLLQLAELAEPPLRLPIGPDAVQRLRTKNTVVAEELDRWHSLSDSSTSS